MTALKVPCGKTTAAVLGAARSDGARRGSGGRPASRRCLALRGLGPAPCRVACPAAENTVEAHNKDEQFSKGTVGSRRVDRRRPRRRRSRLNAASGPESTFVERFGVSETADRSRLNDPLGVGNQRRGRHDANPPYIYPGTAEQGGSSAGQSSAPRRRGRRARRCRASGRGPSGREKKAGRRIRSPQKTYTYMEFCVSVDLFLVDFRRFLTFSCVY